jgi:glycosyltransferase involved in cell wall biosynthesis
VKDQPRVAFFTDSFNEINGVALTSRKLVESARRRERPFLRVSAGPETRQFDDGTISALELKRGRCSFPIELNQRYDILHWRHSKLVMKTLREFQPDIVHITGPSDIGQLGMYVAHALKVPMVASWHTNLHEFGARRLDALVSFLPAKSRSKIYRFTEGLILKGLIRFYQIPRVLMAPNQELIDLLNQSTGKPTFPMTRGVDTEFLNPAKRTIDDGVFRLGFVGRLRPEKNVRFLADLEQWLLDEGHKNFRFLIVGDGGERRWLEKNLKRADFTGMLTGEELARAYANMDLFVFPSRTDTFGNVVLEAQASGVPALVTKDGGPKFLVDHGISGYIARDDRDFLTLAVKAMTNIEDHRRMKDAARQRACAAAWDAVLDELYRAYDVCLDDGDSLGLSNALLLA